LGSVFIEQNFRQYPQTGNQTSVNTRRLEITKPSLLKLAWRRYEILIFPTFHATATTIIIEQFREKQGEMIFFPSCLTAQKSCLSLVL
jgi:hypothetical protein